MEKYIGMSKYPVLRLDWIISSISMDTKIPYTKKISNQLPKT